MGNLPTIDHLGNTAPSTAADRLIEIGVLIAGPLDSVDQSAASQAIEQVRMFLVETYPEFQFKLFRIGRPELSEAGRVEPSVLLQQAVEDRDARHWDFAFVVTAAELVGNYSPYCFAALSRPLDAAVFSLSLIDPLATDADVDVDEQTRVDRIAHRLSRLMLHAFGHLTGLTPSREPTELLFRPVEAKDLDAMELIDDVQRDKQRAALMEIGDQRLEEGSGKRLSLPAFALNAAWINRREIVEAVWAARPWQFPLRLSRLTIASVSTVAILLMTAESWDLALSQSTGRIVALTVFSLLATTAYVVVRQQLLIRRGQQRSEQTIVTSSSALGIVAFGMLVTWLTLLLISLGVGWWLFNPNLIASWASSSDLAAGDVGIPLITRMGCFAASLGLLIGALGASFESQNYFRHVIFVDEEI